MPADTTLPECQPPCAATSDLSDARRLVRGPLRAALRYDTAERVADGLAALAAGADGQDGARAATGAHSGRDSAGRSEQTSGLAADMSPKRRKIAATARMRNMMLVWLGYPERVPECELDGEAAPKARRAYLCGADVAFTRTDRSMVVRDRQRGGWRLMVEDWWHPGVYATKAAALTAGRNAEQAADARAKSAAAREVECRIGWLRSPAIQDWARRRGVDDAAHTLACRIADGEM